MQTDRATRGSVRALLDTLDCSASYSPTDVPKRRDAASSEWKQKTSPGKPHDKEGDGVGGTFDSSELVVGNTANGPD